MLDYLVIDAFTDAAFAGNPAAIVWLDRADLIDDALRQQIAAEFNLSETAYVVPMGEDMFELRWFTPTVEVPLCGHATLAAAEAVRQWGKLRGDSVGFDTRDSGRLTCTFEGDLIQMDFPATPPQPAPLPANAAEVLGVEGPVECIGATTMNLTLGLPSAAQVRAARPQMTALATWHPIGVTITAPGDEPGIDFVSRFFAPAAGIDEDPVTGSAHCTLGPYWAQRLARRELVGHQVSKRGGLVYVTVGDTRVKLGGRAVVVMAGRVRIGR